MHALCAICSSTPQKDIVFVVIVQWFAAGPEHPVSAEVPRGDGPSWFRVMERMTRDSARAVCVGQMRFWRVRQQPAQDNFKNPRTVPK